MVIYWSMSTFYVRQRTKGVPEVVDYAVGDRETWNSKVKTGHETQIYTGSDSQSSGPYVLFGVSYVAPCAWVLFPEGVGVGCSNLPPMYPALLYIVQGWVHSRL